MKTEGLWGLPLFAVLLPTVQFQGFDILTLIAILGIMFAVELAFFMVPGVSFSSLLIATASMYMGFLPILAVSLIAINAAHFIWKKDISLFVPNLLTLIPMIAFASFLGPSFIAQFGWGWFGLSMGLIKWGVALPLGAAFGRNVAKRVANFVLEPPINFLIFWKLNFLFMFLF